jgi:hypothetical protein
MPNEKKPSIYQDRGTIGSARELDEYGVWVKSEPQDLVSGEPNPGEDDFSLDNLPDFPMDFDSPPDSDFSIPEESFSEESFNAGDSEGEESSGELGDLPDFSIDDFSDDFSISGDDSGNEGEGADFPLGEEDPAAAFSLSGEDLDLSLPEDAPAAEAAAPKGETDPAAGEDEGDYEEISLEDFLGGVADEIPGEGTDETPGEKDAEAEDLSSADKSTQLLMKIAEELSSIRAELSALKQEFSAARGAEGESHGFFDDADTDDKIALTGDELNNILNTADFTEETGADAAEGALPDFPEGDTSGAAEGVSPETIGRDLDDPAAAEEPEAGELELPGEAEEAIEFGELPEVGQLEELGAESLDDTELSLVDLSDDSIGADFSIEKDAAGDDTEIIEFPPADSAVILEENTGEEGTEDAGEPDISLDMSFPGEEISLENFEEDALDLTSAVIEEPDLGEEIQENPVLEPALEDIALFGEGENGEDLSLDLESPLESSGDSAPELPPARARGEDLDQIIPEGFVVEEADDEGTGFGDFDSMEEGISLDEIPEAVLPEEDEAAGQRTEVEGPEEPEVSALPGNFKTELKQVLSYMDQLLESLPEEKIEEFAKSEYFDTYKKLFKELGLA